MAGIIQNLLATVSASLGIGPKGARATLDASALTANRTVTLPDKAGTVAMTSDITGGDVRDSWLFG